MEHVVRSTSVGEISATASADRRDQPNHELPEFLGWFGALWALSTFFHLAANSQHLLAVSGIGLLQIGMVVGAGLMLVRPCWPVAGGLASVSLLVLWLKLPVVGNHEIILGLVNLSILIAVGRRRGSWIGDAVPAARLVLLFSYGFIAFSKLNSAFFDPSVSCAVVFGDEFGRWFGLRVSGRTILQGLVIYATATVELAIPVLLVVRWTRRYGVALALGFHFFLALEPVGHVWDFSSVLQPLILLFASPAVHRRLDRWWDGWLARSRDERLLIVALSIAAQCVVVVAGWPAWLVASPIWLLIGGFVLWPVLAVATRPGRFGSLGEPLAIRWWRPVGPAAVVVGLASMIGIAPYTESRSAAAFNMYSNLQVADGVSNHLLVRRPLTRSTEPLVSVVEAPADSPLDFYVERELAVPIRNLSRYHVDRPSDLATVEIDGEVVSVAAAVSGQPSGTGGILAPVRYKLGFRRAVDLSAPAQCLRSWGPAG